MELMTTQWNALIRSLRRLQPIEAMLGRLLRHAAVLCTEGSSCTSLRLATPLSSAVRGSSRWYSAEPLPAAAPGDPRGQIAAGSVGHLLRARVDKQMLCSSLPACRVSQVAVFCVRGACSSCCMVGISTRNADAGCLRPAND